MLNERLLLDLDSGTTTITPTVYQISFLSRPEFVPEIWTGFVRTQITGGDGTSVATVTLQTSGDNAADGWYDLATTTLTAAGTKTEVKDGLRLMKYVRVSLAMTGAAVTARTAHVMLASNAGFTLTAVP